jgi:hypothetical protein
MECSFSARLPGESSIYAIDTSRFISLASSTAAFTSRRKSGWAFPIDRIVPPSASTHAGFPDRLALAQPLQLVTQYSIDGEYAPITKERFAMNILGYSERGLINALLYEIVYTRNEKDAAGLISKLIRMAVWPTADGAGPRIGENEPLTVSTILMEHSFSELGTADCVCLLQTGNRRFAVFLEGKCGIHFFVRQEWNKFAAAVRTGVPYRGLTSNVFCQLYFKQRLAASLANAADNVLEGLVFDAALSRRGRARGLGNNPVVYRAVDLLQEHLQDGAYFLMLLPEVWNNDLANWWRQNVAANELPAGWDVSRWGVITIQQVLEFCNEAHLNRTLEVFTHNNELYQTVAPGGGGPLLGATTGVSLIRAPAIVPDTWLHFSWTVKGGCAVRDYRNNPDRPVPHVIRRRTCDVVDTIQEQRPVELPRQSVTEVVYWQNTIAALNIAAGFQVP